MTLGRQEKGGGGRRDGGRPTDGKSVEGGRSVDRETNGSGG